MRVTHLSPVISHMPGTKPVTFSVSIRAVTQGGWTLFKDGLSKVRAEEAVIRLRSIGYYAIMQAEVHTNG